MTGFDYTSTARRPPYPGLPPEVRSALATAVGGRPDAVRPAGGGFTPGFAAGVRRGDRTVFVKAAPSTEPFAYPAYVREAEVLAVMPEGLPVPRLLDSVHLDVGPGVRWVVLVLEHIDGHMPGGPWTRAQADAVRTSLVELDDGLAGLPESMVRGSFTDGLVDDENLLGTFERFATDASGAPFLPPLAADAVRDLEGLLRAAPARLAGSRVVHNDLRPDNLVIERRSGRAVVCDWNFATRGPAWSDWVGLLPYLRHDGLPAEDLLRASPLSRDADPDAVDSWLAVLAAYMVTSGASAEVPHSPALRGHARFTARIMIDWLSERRKWAA